jgi:sulfur-oxidizing protein SoxY
MQRRTFIKGAIASNLLLVSHFILPNASAALSRDIFSSSSADDAMKALLGEAKAEESDKIEIKAPELAENGAVVPIEVISSIEGTEKIALVIVNNPTPLAGQFTFSEGLDSNIKLRCKIGKPSDVIAVITVGDKVYTKKIHVKVTKGGCA